MANEYVSLLIQIPLVGAFIVFTVALMREFRAQQSLQQERVLNHEEALQKEMQGFINQQNIRWTELLQIERERRKEAMDQGLREVESMVNAIEKLSMAITAQAEAMVRHDAAAVQRHNELVTRFGKP